MAEILVRSIDDVVDRKPLHLELILDDSSLEYYWKNSTERFEEINQKNLFEKYNPGLEFVFYVLKNSDNIFQTRLSILFGVNYTTITHYLTMVRPELDTRQQKKTRLPIRTAYLLAVDFMPVIEGWQKSRDVAASLDISRNNVNLYCLKRQIDSVKFLEKWFVSPLGIIQLKSNLRSKDDIMVESGIEYYSITHVAWEIVKKRKIDDKEQLTYVRRIGHLLKKYPQDLPSLKKRKRSYVNADTLNRLCDLITQSEVCKILKINGYRCRRLCKEGKLEYIPLGTSNWVSYSSLEKLLPEYKKDISDNGIPIPKIGDTEQEKPNSAYEHTYQQLELAATNKEFDINAIKHLSEVIGWEIGEDGVEDRNLTPVIRLVDQTVLRISYRAMIAYLHEEDGARDSFWLKMASLKKHFKGAYDICKDNSKIR